MRYKCGSRSMPMTYAVFNMSLNIPSQLTSEYVNVALHKIEGSLLLLNGSK